MIEPHLPGQHAWGRWGAADERGALNLQTPDVVLAAIGSVRTGTVISLSMPIRGATSSAAPASVPHLRGRPLPQHFMSVDGGDYAAGARPIGDGLMVADDALMVSHHGTTTHMDALCHMWTGDTLYNGHPAARVRSYGATRCGIEKAGPVVGRGILLDVVGRLGVSHLAAGHRIDADQLAACAREAGLEPRAGDIALIRTGWPEVWAAGAERYWSGQPGLTADAAQWLVDADVVMVAADNAAIGALDEHQRAVDELADDLHLLLLWRHGVYIAEMLQLEELAAAMRAAGRWEGLFMAAPLAIEGGTGSPINPVIIL